MVQSKKSQLFDILLHLTKMNLATRKQIADYALNEAISLTFSKISFIGFINSEQTIMRTHAWSESAWKNCQVEDPYIDFPIKKAGLWAEAIRQRKSIIVNDFEKPNPLKKGFPEGHLALSRFLSVPIIDEDHVIAIIAVGNKSTDYSKLDIQNLQILLLTAWRMIQRRDAFEALEQERIRFKLILDQAVDWEIWRKNSTYLYISPSCQAITGYSAEEFYTNPNLRKEIIIEEDHKVWDDHEQQNLKDEQQSTIEFRIRNKSGDVRWIEHRCSVVPESISPLGGRRESNRDITLRKIAQQEIKKLKGLLPICSSCKKIRDEGGNWQLIESYIHDHSEAEFTHGMCPECIQKYYPDLAEK
ncbi:hypothetical protein NEF87_002523 [Candidatus Lokiarchaeum ossiferum]|uniref:PAC domain-containing protein n=1 Tax=Candidatus Lokiarchaeum ossiferum TaxID=2951803 RepID=A0ABY6HRU8_9ARCH|nr:hypothetical protein NEF87_002523 [Candidatus Lokiarchaeum sp. B-35]